MTLVLLSSPIQGMCDRYLITHTQSKCTYTFGLMTEATTNYTREQLINALVAEFEWYAHDGDDMGQTVEEYKKGMEHMSISELVYDTCTDEDVWTLEDFMHRYG